MKVRHVLLTILLLGSSWLSSAAPAVDTVHTEIQRLLGHLASSGCEFNRNGSWYTGAQAKDHLTTKLDYLDKHGGVRSAEQFIEQAASASSVSGQAYQVRCASGAAVPSSLWLTQQLQQLRKAKPVTYGEAANQ